MKLYENCRFAIRISYFGFLLIAFGFIILNKNVNIFYTFSNTFIINIANGSLRLGRAIILNLPLIFMVNFVCKKANSGVPIILSIIGYLTYLITMSLFANQSLPIQAYHTGLSDILTLGEIAGYPFETGLIGSMAVGLATRYAYVHSRHRGSYSVLGFLNKDTSAIIYNIVYCALLGIAAAYAYPLFYSTINTAITYISQDLSDPRRIALYGVLDRTLSVLGNAGIIRYPFWFTSAGGSYSSLLTGQVITGDVNIWEFIQDATSTYQGAGRFITPYYVINMFIVPSIYFGMYLTMTNKKDRQIHILPMIGIMLLSFIAGNPLPMELSLLFTAPLLLIIYIIVSSLCFGFLSYFNIFLGFEMSGTDVITAMPGSFPDFIINIRNIRLISNLRGIIIVGLIAGFAMFLLTLIFYRFLAYDFAKTGKRENISNLIIKACGGKENIVDVSCSLLRVYIELKELELVSYNRLQELNAKKIVETKKGIGIQTGVSSSIIANAIIKEITGK